MKKNLEKQVIILKHLNIQLEKQIIRSKGQTEIEKHCRASEWTTR